jgi:hypothetical protein
MNRVTILAAAAAAGLVVSAPVLAMSASSLPPEHVQGRVKYRTGGVGHDEAVAMQKTEVKYPLSLEFVKRAKPADEYLASIDVTIKDAKGRTDLSATADGPFLLAALPAGHYTIVASDDGTTKTRNVDVNPKKPERLVFEW